MLCSVNYGRPAGGGPYDHALFYHRANARRQSLVTNVDKVKVAREICRSKADLTILDLQARINEIIRMIQAANR